MGRDAGCLMGEGGWGRMLGTNWARVDRAGCWASDGQLNRLRPVPLQQENKGGETGIMVNFWGLLLIFKPILYLIHGNAIYTLKYQRMKEAYW